MDADCLGSTFASKITETLGRENSTCREKVVLLVRVRSSVAFVQCIALRSGQESFRMDDQMQREWKSRVRACDTMRARFCRIVTFCL